MNYIKHLTGFFEKVSTDYDLNPTHISLYMAVFQLWNQNRFQNPISISRDELMRISKIASTATYHKCMKDLNERAFVIYKPSFNPFKGSILEVCNLDFYTKPVPKKELKKLKTNSKNSQVDEQVAKQHTKQVVEQVVNKLQTSTKHVPYINNINTINSLNLGEQSQIENEKKIISLKFENNEIEKLEVEKEKKLRQKKKNENPADDNLSSLKESLAQKPNLEEAQIFFSENNFSAIEAHKFFNYFESNGWLVGGKTKMKDWKAAARNWMLNANKYANNKPNQTGSSTRSNTRESVLVPNHLHVANQKNYGEAL